MFGIRCLGEGYLYSHRENILALHIYLDSLYVRFFHNSYVITHLLMISALTDIHSLHCTLVSGLQCLPNIN